MSESYASRQLHCIPCLNMLKIVCDDTAGIETTALHFVFEHVYDDTAGFTAAVRSVLTSQKGGARSTTARPWIGKRPPKILRGEETPEKTKLSLEKCSGLETKNSPRI